MEIQDQSQMNESTQPINDEGLRCPKCEYNLTGLTEEVCPECGEAFDPILLASEMASRFAAMTIWSRRHKIGIMRAFFKTALAVWLHPERFARQFPKRPNHHDASRFAQVCMVHAVLIALTPHLLIAGLKFGACMFCFGITLCVVIGITVSERTMAATFFGSINADDTQPGDFRQSLSFAHMTRAHLLPIAVWIGPVYAWVIHTRPFPKPDTLITYGFLAIIVYRWISMAFIAGIYRKNHTNLIMGIILTPACVAFGGIVGFLTGAIIESVLPIF